MASVKRMKKLICIIMLILIPLISFNFASGADWILIGKSKDGNKSVFVDKESILQISEGIVTSCQKYVYVKPILFDQVKKPVTEVIVKQEWNCDEEKYNNLKLTLLYIDSKRETETYAEALWHYVEPDTLEDDVCDYVCNH
jgi:Surface-adhesin protein E